MRDAQVTISSSVDFSRDQQMDYDEWYSDFLLGLVIEVWMQRLEHRTILALPTQPEQVKDVT